VAARIASTLLVVGLLVGTAVAFAVTERLKLVRSPIAAPRIDSVFGPLCECPRQETGIAFLLREPDVVTLSVVDADDNAVRTLIADRPMGEGDVEAVWDGRDEAGEVVPEGSYRPRVTLDRQRRTITLPNPIRVDTTPPEIRVVEAAPRILSPGIGERNNRLDVFYEVSEPARGMLFVNGVRHVYTRARPLEGKMEWFGIREGRRLPAGVYELEVAAEDVAGNVSGRVHAGRVQIRYITLAREVIRVPAEARFGVGVTTDADRFSWRLAGGTGTAEPGLLVLRAPRDPGRYTLFVDVDGRGARAEVIVSER
jgi:hypothetical protein